MGTMRRALEFGLVLLTVAAAAAGRPALAANPSDNAQFFMNGAAARQGYLGVDVRDIPADQVTTLKLRDTRGAEVMMVDHDAPAGKCGLREHDVILQMNGAQIEGRDQVRRMLHELPPGRALQLLISREGQQMTLSTQMSTREEVEKLAWERLTPAESQGGDGADLAQSGLGSHGAAKSFLGNVLNAPAYTGAMLEKMTSQLADYFGVPAGVGLLVRNVEPNSPAAQAGMHAGDVVVKAASRSVCNLNDWAHALKAGKNKPVAVTVLRDKKEQTLTLTLDPKRRSSLHRPDEDPNRLGFSFKSK